MNTVRDLVAVRPGFESLTSGLSAFDIFAPLIPSYAQHSFPFKHYIGVADTTTLLRDLKYTVREEKLTNLMLAARGGSLRLYAAKIVRQELFAKIPELTSVMGWDSRYAEAIWSEYYDPWIRYVDASGLPPVTPEAVATFLVDPDDGPTAQLVSLLNPDFIFSNNYRHFAGYELLGDDWVCVAVACRETSEYQLVLVPTTMALGIMFHATKELVGAVARLDKRWLFGLGIGVGIGVVLALLHSKSRRWLAQEGPELVTQAFEIVDDIVVRMERAFTAKYTAAVAASYLIEGRRRHLHQPRRLRDFATAALARATAPFTAETLLTEAVRQGYCPRGEGSSGYLESRVLRAYPQLFRQTTGGKWELATLIIPRRREFSALPPITSGPTLTRPRA